MKLNGWQSTCIHCNLPTLLFGWCLGAKVRHLHRPGALQQAIDGPIPHSMVAIKITQQSSKGLVAIAWPSSIPCPKILGHQKYVCAMTDCICQAACTQCTHNAVNARMRSFEKTNMMHGHGGGFNKSCLAATRRPSRKVRTSCHSIRFYGLVRMQIRSSSTHFMQVKVQGA